MAEITLRARMEADRPRPVAAPKPAAVDPAPPSGAARPASAEAAAVGRAVGRPDASVARGSAMSLGRPLPAASQAPAPRAVSAPPVPRPDGPGHSTPVPPRPTRLDGISQRHEARTFETPMATPLDVVRAEHDAFEARESVNRYIVLGDYDKAQVARERYEQLVDRARALQREVALNGPHVASRDAQSRELQERLSEVLQERGDGTIPGPWGR
jgi:hypothetical protein